MVDLFQRALRIEPIQSIEDLEQRVQELGFFPMFRSGIRKFSVYENTPRFWTEDEDGPWEWKGPMIRNGNVAYGKFFNRKAGYVSLEWLPHFLNYRRSKRIAPNEDSAALDEMVLQTIEIEGRTTIKELRQLLGLSRRRRQPDDLVIETEIEGKVNLDTNLTRLMMEGRVCIADFAYNIDKRGNRYGWGIAKYTTPELLYGNFNVDYSPEESYDLMTRHLKKILKRASEMQIKKLLM